MILRTIPVRPGTKMTTKVGGARLMLHEIRRSTVNAGEICVCNSVVNTGWLCSSYRLNFSDAEELPKRKWLRRDGNLAAQSGSRHQSQSAVRAPQRFPVGVGGAPAGYERR